MKRILAFILLLTLCLSLIACNGNSDNNNDNADKDGTSQSIDGPAANDDNTMLQYPEKPQKYVVNYIRDMAMTGWTPEKTFQLYGKYQAWSYNLTYEEGKKYYGLPFLVDSRGTKQEFNNAIKDGVYVGGTSDADCIGDACYDAVYVSLIQVCPSISFKSTEDMLPANNTGLLQVGEWDASASSHDTKELIQNNPLAVMAKAYAQLKPGDVVLKHIVAQDAGHTRIVSGGPVLYYNSDNSIDSSKSYITTIEQTNVWDKQVTHNTTWWVDHVYTFYDLYTNNFVPLTPADYTADLEAPYITAKDIIDKDDIAKARKLEGELSSNHYITEVSVTITNPEDKVIFESKSYPNAKKVWLEDMDFAPRLYNYEGGKYVLNIEASLSFGTKNIAQIEFILE